MPCKENLKLLIASFVLVSIFALNSCARRAAPLALPNDGTFDPTVPPPPPPPVVPPPAGPPAPPAMPIQDSPAIDPNVLNNGVYSSQQFVASGTPPFWNSFRWTPDRPYLKELPNQGVKEMSYGDGTAASGNVDMASNILLMHFDQPAMATLGSFSDDSKGGTALTCTNCPAVAAGRFGSGLSFTNVNQYLETPVVRTALSGLRNNFAISAWINPNGQVLSGSDTDWIIVAHGRSNGQNGFAFKVHRGGTNYGLRFTAYQKYDCDTSGSPIVLNTWQHVAVSMATDNTITTYVNGVAIENNCPRSNVDATTDKLYVGTTTPMGGNPPMTTFSGSLDEVAIFNQALDAQTITNFYKRGAQRLRFQLRFNANSAFIGPDGTSNSFFSELYNRTAGLPSFTFTAPVQSNFVQYQATLSSDNPNPLPTFKNVTVGILP